MVKQVIDYLQEYSKTTGDQDIDIAIGNNELPLTYRQAKRLIKLRYGKSRS